MKSICIAFLTLAALTATASAADKPNFSGDWKLNAAKSNMGPLPAPTSYIRKVTHAEPSITIEDTQVGTALGDQHDTRTYTTDGKEIAYQANGADVKSSTDLGWRCAGHRFQGLHSGHGPGHQRQNNLGRRRQNAHRRGPYRVGAGRHRPYASLREAVTVTCFRAPSTGTTLPALVLGWNGMVYLLLCRPAIS